MEKPTSILSVLKGVKETSYLTFESEGEIDVARYDPINQTIQFGEHCYSPSVFIEVLHVNSWAPFNHVSHHEQSPHI